MKRNIEDFFVPWLRDQKMYVSPHIELAWKEPNLHRMMSNENPHEPSPKVLEAITTYARMANRYPDQGLVVRSKIAEINGLDGPENVLIGNGSSEVFDMICRSLVTPGEEVIQHTPCFGIYKLCCAALGGKLISVPMGYTGDKFLFDPEAIIDAVTPKTKVIVIANPNNPTGNFMDPKGFIMLADLGFPLVVDEAYVDYAGMHLSQVGLIKKYKNVMVTRTLSKAYGLAGLRFGYLLAHKEVIDVIAATLIPWNVGTIPMWAALAALDDTEGLKKRIDFNSRQIAYVEESLQGIPYLTVFHTNGNYILMHINKTDKTGREMVEFAQKKGIIFRPQSEMYGSNGFFRLTIGSQAENKLAVETIQEFINS